MVLVKFAKMSLKLTRQLFMLILLAGILAFPIMGLLQIPLNIFERDSRKVIALGTFNTRSVDSVSRPVILFNEPLISITFDDGRESVYSKALPILQKYGIKTTQYLLSGTSDNQLHLSKKQIKQFYQMGHEIGCHTITHPDLTTLTDAQLTFELTDCQKQFKDEYGIIKNFASPYGHTNSNTMSAIKKYYSSHRNTNGDITNGVSDKDVNIIQNFDKYNIISATIRHDTSVEELTEAVEYAKKNNGWLVFTYHQIEDTDNSVFGLDPESLETQLKYLSSTNVRIVTFKEALESVNMVSENTY